MTLVILWLLSSLCRFFFALILFHVLYNSLFLSGMRSVVYFKQQFAALVVAEEPAESFMLRGGLVR